MEPAPQSDAGSPQTQSPESSDTWRQARIAMLKHAIENGAYNVSAEHITDKMLMATLIDVLV